MATATVHNEDGLQVDINHDHAAKAPEVDPRYLDMYSNRSPDNVQIVQQKRLPFGWSLWALLTLAAVISALIIGAGVGGGLGAKLADCKTSAPSSTSTQTTSPTKATACTNADSVKDDADGYAPKLPIDVTNLTKPDACSEKGGPNSFTATAGLKFTFWCGMDFVGSDIIGFVAYTFKDCIDACARMNAFAKEDEVPCKSVVFVLELSDAWEQHQGNCWLKSAKASKKEEFTTPQNIYAEPPAD